MDRANQAQIEAQPDNNWTFVGPPPASRQGWKLYVSASNANFAATLEAVRPIFSRHSVSFKHVSGDRALRKINSGLYGYTQIGKTIVAYLGEQAVAEAVVQELKPKLRRFANSTMLPPFADEIGGGLPLSYRYGAFSGDVIVIDGVSQPDRRSIRSSSANGLPASPFTSMLEPSSKDASLDTLLVSYPVFEVISQSAKGGIYAAMDLSSCSFREVILKLGRRNGHVLPDGRNGSDLIRRESWFYLQAKEKGLEHLTAGYDGMFEFDDGVVVILERIDGESLQERHQRGDLDLSTVQQAILILEEFHRADLLVGDAKLANFMVAADGTLKAIDFEAGSQRSDGMQCDQHTTFMFTDTALGDVPEERELLHFLYSILHKDQSASFDETTRIIDLEAVLKIVDPVSSLDASVRNIMRDIYARAQ